MARSDLANNAFRNAQRLLDRTMDSTFEPVTTITRQDAEKLARDMKLDDTVTNLDGSPWNTNMNQEYEAEPASVDLTPPVVQEENLLPKKTWKDLFPEKGEWSLNTLGAEWNEFMEPMLKKDPTVETSFQEDLIESESSGDYNIVNKSGFMGAYQFGNARLDDYREATNTKFTNSEFVDNKELQDKVFEWHQEDIKEFITEKALNTYIGQKINGVEVTENGLVAVAHLGGKAGMLKFLKTNGRYNPSDGKTKLSDYLKKFK